MAKGKKGTSTKTKTKYVSKGERRNVSKATLKMIRRGDKENAFQAHRTKLLNQMDAVSKRKRTKLDKDYTKLLQSFMQGFVMPKEKIEKPA